MTFSHPREGEIGPEKPSDKPYELPPPPAPPRQTQFGIRHIMMLSVLVALVVGAVAQAARTGLQADAVLAGLTCAIAFILLGLCLTRWLVRWTLVGWIAIILGLLVVSNALTGWLTLVVMPVMLTGMILLILRRRALEQDALLWVLALAAERNRPLGPAVTALAYQTGGVYRLRALRLAECLDHGMPLPDSLDFVRRSAPAVAKVMIRVGHESGSLAEALRDAAESRSARPPGWQNFGAKVGYLFLIFAVLQAITAFVLYFIAPKFEAIFKDFGIELPLITRYFSMASYWLTTTYMVPILSAAELFAMLYTVFALLGYGQLSVPIIDRLFLRRHTVLILRCLAMIVEGEKPIGLGLQILARWYPTRWVRERLAGAFVATNQGIDWIDALRRYRLIGSADVALLESARRVGNLPWALRELAEGSARRLGYRMQVVSHVFITLVFLAVAAMVGVFAVSYFYPLVTLIERLAR
jgi:type II secretory pathway component PulF